MVDHPASQPLPNGISAVTTLRLSRRPSCVSAVGASGISAVTILRFSREATAEMPLKVGYTGGLYKGGVAFQVCFFAGVFFSTICSPLRRPAARTGF